MLLSSLLTFTFVAAVIAQKDAPIINGEPQNAAYEAMLQTDKPVNGMIEGVSNKNSTGVSFNIDFYAFPKGQGPFGKLSLDKGSVN